MEARIRLSLLISGFILGALGSASAQAPAIHEEFNGWTGATSPDGVWRRNGNWTATGGNLFTLDNCTFSPSFEGKPGGYLTLTVKAGKKEGGEIQTLGGGSGIGFKCNYGYYEVRMKLPKVPGICASFFRIGNQYAGNPEIDVEFLTPDFANTPGQGKVRCMLHPGNGGPRNLPFNPSEDFHRYGFLFTPQRVQWTADGKVIQTIESVALGGDGIIMMNAWTGNPDWGGGPPAQDAHTVYDWVKYWPGATSIPVEASSVQSTLQLPANGPRFGRLFLLSGENRLGAAVRDGADSRYYGITGRWMGGMHEGNQ